MAWPPAHAVLIRLPNLPARGNMLLGRVFPGGDTPYGKAMCAGWDRSLFGVTRVWSLLADFDEWLGVTPLHDRV